MDTPALRLPKVLYYLSSFGYPNANLKTEILKHNLNILNKFAELDLLVNHYDEYYEFDDDVKGLVKNFHSFRKPKAMMNELWLANRFDFSGYDFIFFILDDIKLSPFFDLHRMIVKMNIYQFDIISPAINDLHYSYMTNSLFKSSAIRTVETKYLELFLYLMKPATLQDYLDIQDETNPSTVGMDLVLNIIYDFKLGLDYENYANHLFDTADSHRELRQMFIATYLKKFGFGGVYEVFKKHGFPLEQLRILDSDLVKQIDAEKRMFQQAFEPETKVDF